MGEERQRVVEAFALEVLGDEAGAVWWDAMVAASPSKKQRDATGPSGDTARVKSPDATMASLRMCETFGKADRWPVGEDIDPARPTWRQRSSRTGDDVPPFVHRAAFTEAEAAVERAAQATHSRDRLIVLMGNPDCGKTRIALELLKAHPALKRRRLLKLRSPSLLPKFSRAVEREHPSGFASPTVVLIDDLQRGFDQIDDVGRDLDRIARRPGVIVLVTVHPIAPPSGTSVERELRLAEIGLDADTRAQLHTAAITVADTITLAELEQAAAFRAALTDSGASDEVLRRLGHHCAAVDTLISIWDNTHSSPDPLENPCRRVVLNSLLDVWLTHPAQEATDEEFAELVGARSRAHGDFWPCHPSNLKAALAFAREPAPGDLIAFNTSPSDHRLHDHVARYAAALASPESHHSAKDVAVAGLRCHQLGEREASFRWWKRGAELDHPNAILGMGMLAIEDGDWESGYAWYRRAADLDQPVAMLILGSLASKDGDVEGARSWWERAAQLDNPQAMAYLGVEALEDGDVEGARSWWERAAQLDNPQAMVNLGVEALEGGDVEGARSWWERAAQLDNPQAIVNLGLLAKEGGDEVAAREWWERAARLGLPEAVYNLAVLAHENGGVELAVPLYVRAADLGDPNAMSNLGAIAHQAGDLQAARTWYRAAADTGHADAMHNLGSLANESGAVGDAYAWWERAANHGHLQAMSNLGFLAQQGGDVDGARNWWERAAQLGDPQAMSNLGLLAQQGGELDGARNWWERAAQLGHPQAMFNLAALAFQDGDAETERAWLQPAAELNHPESCFNLGAIAQRKGDLKEARAWFERARAAGSTDATAVLKHLDSMFDGT